MKFGLIRWEATDNIGDDIQAYAALCQLPRVDYLIDREHMDTFAPEKDGEQVAVIMNGWFLHNLFNWPPSPYLYPFLISMHFTQRGYIIQKDVCLKGSGGDFLKKHGPVGARDENSLKAISELGIDAYHSGCLTLTLPREEGVERGNEILLVDLKEEQVEHLYRRFPNETFHLITHDLTKKEFEPWEDRLNRVKTLLSRYQRAKCVITSRLHCALPCLALGTSVLMVYEDDFADRIGSFLRLLHYCTSDNYQSEVEHFLNNLPENKQDYLVFRNDLIRRCREFVKETESVDRLEEVPPLSQFKTYWQEKAIYKETIIDEQIQAYRDTIAQLESWSREQDKVKNWFLSQIESKDMRIQELEAWTEELEKGKAWLEEHWKSEEAARIAAEESLQRQRAKTEELEKGKAWLEEHWKSEEAARIAAEESLQRQKAKTEELEEKLRLLTDNKLIQFFIKIKKLEI